MSRKILLMALLSLPLSAEEWSKADILMEGAFQALLITDWRQSIQSPGYVEDNPFLAKRPSKRALNTACLGASLGHLAVTNYLEGRSRKVWLLLTITGEAAAVGNNYQVGIRIHW